MYEIITQHCCHDDQRVCPYFPLLWTYHYLQKNSKKARKKNSLGRSLASLSTENPTGIDKTNFHIPDRRCFCSEFRLNPELGRTFFGTAFVNTTSELEYRPVLFLFFFTFPQRKNGRSSENAVSSSSPPPRIVFCFVLLGEGVTVPSPNVGVACRLCDVLWW